MKIAVVYNREKGTVINLFGRPNREKIGLRTINRLVTALRDGGHQVTAIEGDKDLVDRLEEFMPRVVKGERPGLVFNVSYGIQGQARYTHVPSILEMVGIPYVASGPLAHSLCLDKVVTKMILRQNGLPTPDFVVMQTPDAELPDLTYPFIVKPKNEAVSFGLKVVQNEAELRQAATVIFDEFSQAVLAEQFIEGREVNVGLLGNDPPEAFPPVELLFGAGGPAIYTYEDKVGRSGRTISHRCPAEIGDELTEQAKDLARRAFTVLGCYDCARVDMRLDSQGRLYILELNSLPSLGEHGSYLVGADAVGLDFAKFINRLVEVAAARYFGTLSPPSLSATPTDPDEQVFRSVTGSRDRMERRLKEWVGMNSRTDDPVGIQQATSEVSSLFEDLNMRPVKVLTDAPWASTWETRAGLEGGVLLIANLDVPIDVDLPSLTLRRDPEWLFGEGVGSSRAPLVMLEFALRALRRMRRLRTIRLGVLVYSDEGAGAIHSADTIRAAAVKAREVFVLRPSEAGKVVTSRRGHRRLRLRCEAEPQRLGKAHRQPDVLRWAWSKLEPIAGLSSQRHRLQVATIDLRSERLPMGLPHRVTATIVITAPTTAASNRAVEEIRAILGRGGPKWQLSVLSDRPPFSESPGTAVMVDRLAEVGARWELPLERQSSSWPSVAGLVPADTPCVCGVGPVARDLRTPQEAVQRISLVQRTLVLAQYLAQAAGTED